MPWTLEISTIDVGQGDSSLIIADDGAGQVRSMLIDAGTSGYGTFVNDHVLARLAAHGVDRLDRILVSHYDADHVGGVTSILASDNLAGICRTAATAGMAAYNAANVAGRQLRQQKAAAAAAAAAVVSGAYNDVSTGRDYSALAVAAGAAGGQLVIPAAATELQIANSGADAGRAYVLARRSSAVLIPGATSTRHVGNATTFGIANGATDALRIAVGARRIFGAIRRTVTNSFWTAGAYRGTEVIDLGDRPERPGRWEDSIDGYVLLRSYGHWAPGTGGRLRNSLNSTNRGDELLWNSGANAVAAPAGAPAAFVVCCNTSVWCTNQIVQSSQPQNDAAIGLVFRFGNFFYFTAGDLPGVGERLVATSVLANGFPNPQGGGNFPVATRIPAFKVGHHGSGGSSPAAFLTAINPQAAMISCGFNGFGRGDRHPTQEVIDRLQAGVPRFYLTNCKYSTNHVPASDGLDQLSFPLNRSRVCGDNADNNKAAGRQRGISRLYLNQAESAAVAGPARQFHVEYWDNDDHPLVWGTLIGVTTEDHPF